jgi:MFS family permease
MCRGGAEVSRRWFAGLTGNTFLLAFASLFADISSEMIIPLLPVYLTQTLGAGANRLGIIEGFAQATQYVVQGLSGWLSDKLQHRKPIALVGYVLGAVAKPLIGVATAWPGVLGARALDRLGSGTRSAPRDALIAASADEANRGKAFGLEGMGDNLGAFLGPLLALTLVGVWQLELSTIFLLAFVPGSLAMLMIALVRERPAAATAKAKLDFHIAGFPTAYWAYLGVTALFGVGNSSNAFLILRSADLSASMTSTIVVYAFFNLIAALVSYPAGYLSDHLGRKRVLLASFVIFAVVYLGFAITTKTILVSCLFAFYGLFEGTFRSVGKALAADLAPAPLRASGIGWYMATVGMSGLIANIVGGQLWTSLGPSATFCLGAITALIGGLGLALFVSARPRS